MNIHKDRTAPPPLNPDLLIKYVGRYGFEGNTTIRVLMDGESLTIYEPHNGNFSLIPISSTRFIAEDLLIPVSFELGSNGSPVRMLLETAKDVKASGVFLGR